MIGFLVNASLLAIALVQRLWHGTSPHGNTFALSVQEQLMLQWMVLSAVGRLAALNLGSHEVAGVGRAQTAMGITRKRVVIVFLTLMGMAALAFGAALASRWMDAVSTTALTSTSRVARWIGIAIAVGLFVGLFMAVGLWYIRILVRVWRAIKETTEESANSTGLIAVEAWLAIIDGGNYGQSWETAAAYFQRTISQEEWVGQMEKVRRPLGKVRSRKLGSTKFTPGWTRFGEKFAFATSFDGLLAATETVTFARQPDGEWKAMDYDIRPAGLK